MGCIHCLTQGNEPISSMTEALSIAYIRPHRNRFLSLPHLEHEKLHVRYTEGADTQNPVIPRRYTLTHSDTSGDLFLTIGTNYDKHQIAGWYTRLMRDEVLAEWRNDGDYYALHIHCHVSGGFAFGPASFRYQTFQRELGLVLEALRHGDPGLFATHPELDLAPILIHFESDKEKYRRIEEWGTPLQYR